MYEMDLIISLVMTVV